MGEPLANYDNVLQAVRRIQADLGIGARHITISTVGLVPRIINLADENLQVQVHFQWRFCVCMNVLCYVMQCFVRSAWPYHCIKPQMKKEVC